MAINEWEVLTNNPFKVCSDEWCDRSFINSQIVNITSDIEQEKETIDDYSIQIQKEKDRGFYPNPWSERVEEHINNHVNALFTLKEELKALNAEGRSDKEKIERYWVIHNHGY